MPGGDGAPQVLLVEDDPAIVELMQLVLADEGLTVDVARTGTRALEMARQRRPQVAILDLGLPEMYGKTLGKNLRKLYPDLPLLVVSALPSNAVAQDAWEMGAFSYITKPFELDVLSAAVKRGLDLGRAHTIH
ncbi:MAG TPA: response regulator [Chloroflexota bacterium]|nr:response regulator [Chloroflexota bacterium]